MSTSGVTRYIVTFHYDDSGLAAILKLNSTLVNNGFSTTMNDDKGHPHELGSNSFGIVSAMSKDEITQQAQGLGEIALDARPDVEVQTLEAFLTQPKAD